MCENSAHVPALPPERPPHIGQRALAGFIGLYRVTFSALLGRQCRFLPSCSEYAQEAILRHGVLRGSRLAAQRIARCHPWGGSGYDPVP